MCDLLCNPKALMPLPFLTLQRAGRGHLSVFPLTDFTKSTALTKCHQQQDSIFPEQRPPEQRPRHPDPSLLLHLPLSAIWAMSQMVLATVLNTRVSTAVHATLQMTVSVTGQCQKVTRAGPYRSSSPRSGGISSLYSFSLKPVLRVTLSRVPLSSWV